MDERGGAAPASGIVSGNTLSGEAETLAARIGASVLRLRVVEGFDVTPSMRRLRLHCGDLGAFTYEAGQDLMVTVPSDGPTVIRRRYTIRNHDRDASTVDLDISRHSNGPGALWATHVQPGGEVEAIGPRGKVVLRRDADWHLFIGDETFLPAIASMIEAIPQNGTAVSIIEVDGAHEQQPLPTRGGDTVWLHRGDRKPGDPSLLTDAAASIALPPGQGHAYIGGERQVVAEITKILLGRGMTDDQVSPKKYWRLGAANAAHGEPVG